jgi:hypothetical protein
MLAAVALSPPPITNSVPAAIESGPPPLTVHVTVSPGRAPASLVTMILCLVSHEVPWPSRVAFTMPERIVAALPMDTLLAPVPVVA